MLGTYKTPGVYVEEIAKLPPSIAPVETAIPAFIGHTEKAQKVNANDLHLVPTRITSIAEYESYFGGPQPEEGITVSATGGASPAAKAELTLDKRSRHIMYYALQMFFANGGGACYVVSAGPYEAFASGTPAGPVASKLTDGLNAVKLVDEPTLLVFPEAQFLAIADFKSLHDAALVQCLNLQDRFLILDVHGGTESLFEPTTNLTTAVANFRSNGIDKDNLKYGAAYGPNIVTTLPFVYDETKTVVTFNSRTQPLSGLKASDNAIYSLAQAAIASLRCVLPPSSAIAGVYATVDSARGVWKAPANVSLKAVVGPSILSTNAEQDGMNVDPTAGKSVNAIRSFTGIGTLVWGARTLAGNDNEWRYVNVRRFFIFVEESVKKATMQFVFEPNDANTWVKVQGMIENFLTTLWRQGALQGVKPEHAFYVSVGLGKTMTPLDILEGRMIVEIGMAAVRPAEFIVLKFSHKMAES